MYKSYKNFWKDFVVEQNLTRPKGNFWSYLNREMRLVSDRPTNGKMDPWNIVLYENKKFTSHPIPSQSAGLIQVIRLIALRQ